MTADRCESPERVRALGERGQPKRRRPSCGLTCSIVPATGPAPGDWCLVAARTCDLSSVTPPRRRCRPQTSSRRPTSGARRPRASAPTPPSPCAYQRATPRASPNSSAKSPSPGSISRVAVTTSATFWSVTVRGRLGAAGRWKANGGGERALGALAPGDAAPAAAGQRRGGVLGKLARNGLLARSAATGARPDRPGAGRVDLLGARDADRPDQAARAQPVSEGPAAAVAGVGQHAAEAPARGDHAVDLGQRDLGLGPRGARRFGDLRIRAAERSRPSAGTAAGRPAPRGVPA